MGQMHASGLSQLGDRASIVDKVEPKFCRDRDNIVLVNRACIETILGLLDSFEGVVTRRID